MEKLHIDNGRETGNAYHMGKTRVWEILDDTRGKGDAGSTNR